MNVVNNKVKTELLTSRFDRIADRYPQNSFLQREVANRLIDRSQLIKIYPKAILDLGCGAGYLTNELARHYPEPKIIGIDNSRQMINTAIKHSHPNANIEYIHADILNTKLEEKFDLVVANFALPILNSDINLIFKKITNYLAPNGLFLFSSLGPDTLKELKYSWSKVDNFDRVNNFQDLHILGDILFNLGFNTPVLDREIFTLLYDNAEDILFDLKNNGSFYKETNRPNIITTKKMLLEMSKHYNTLKNNENKLPVTIEVIYGHVWNNNITVDIPTQIVAT